MSTKGLYIVRVTTDGKYAYVASRLALLAAGKELKTFTHEIRFAECYATKDNALTVASWANRLISLENPAAELNAQVIRYRTGDNEKAEKAVAVDPTHILLKRYTIDDDPECESRIAQKVKEFIWEIEHKEKYLPFKTVLANDNAPGAISYVTDRVLDKVRRYYGIAVGGVLAWQHESLAKRFLYKNTRNELRKYAKAFTFSQKYVDICSRDRSWSEIDKDWARSLMKCDKDLPNAILALNGYYRLGLMTHGSTPKTELTEQLYELAHPHNPAERWSFVNENLPVLAKAIRNVAVFVANLVSHGPDFDRIRHGLVSEYVGTKYILIDRICVLLSNELATLHPENLGRISQNSDDWEAGNTRWPYRPAEDTLALRMMFWLVRKKVIRTAIHQALN